MILNASICFELKTLCPGNPKKQREIIFPKNSVDNQLEMSQSFHQHFIDILFLLLRSILDDLKFRKNGL
jgi:hypothetical protein